MKKTITKLTIATLLLGIGYAVSVSAVGVSDSPAAATKTYGKVEHPVADFDNQIANGIVILDFFATWCPPCKRFGPIFTTAAARHTNILFIKVDVEKHPEIASKYGVRSMPTIIALKDGKRVKTNVGFMNNTQFNSWIGSLS